MFAMYETKSDREFIFIDESDAGVKRNRGNIQT
jgi:hypothetical protein